MNLLKIAKLFRRLRCWFVGHNIYTLEEKGISPTKEQLANGVEGFFDYTKLLCKKCDYEYKGPPHV